MEVHRVGAALPLDRVAAVTRIPHERVVAPTTKHEVIAAVTVDRVVPVTAQQRVVTVTAADRVVPWPAVDRQRSEGRHAVARVHGVVAVAGLNVDRTEGAAVEAEIGRAVLTDVHSQRAAVGHQGELVARAVTGDLKYAVLHLRRVGRKRRVGGEAEERKAGRARGRGY